MNNNNPLIKNTNNRPASVVPAISKMMQPAVVGPFGVNVPALLNATPAPAQTSAAQPSQQDILITRLLALPAQIMMAQTEYDKQDFLYREQLAQITLRAFSVPLFPGKKEGEGLRCASNDTEREAAINHLATTHAGLITAAQMREIALRGLMQVKNEFEAIKYTIQLLTSK